MAPARAVADGGEFSASVPVQANAQYAWTISGGKIDSGNGTDRVTWSVDSPAPAQVTLGCTVTNEARTSTVGTVNVPVLAPSNCPTPAATPALLSDLAKRFDSDVFPQMASGPSSCVSCHAADSGRTLQIGATGTDTFYKLRTSGLLGPGGSGTMLNRLVRVDGAAMPQTGDHWSSASVDRLFAVTCALADTDAATRAIPDESFPVELLQPYTGAKSTLYDNTVLSYDQLRGRIRAQFGDDWVRGGEDRFATNVRRFGGGDYLTSFVPNREITSDYLLAMDQLAGDVCGQAVSAGTGPFAAVAVDAPTFDPEPEATTKYQLATWQGTTGAVSGSSYLLWSNGEVHQSVTFPADGDYNFTVVARGQEAGPDLPLMGLNVDGKEQATWSVPQAAYASYSIKVHVADGARLMAVTFLNDYYMAPADRNLYVQSLTIDGPLPGTTGGVAGAEAATRSSIGHVFESLLLRQAQADEIQPLYELLRELEIFTGDRKSAWTGVCEGLLKHPDFLFTRPPTFDAAPTAERAPLLLIKLALDLLDRPPTTAEFAALASGKTINQFIDQWLVSAEFQNAYFRRLRLVLESDGTTEADEPVRLWTYLTMQDRPLRELLTAEYSVDAAFTRMPRGVEHGPSGVLSMPGYLKHKPGLPHYNYAARVLSDFMGYVFEVPPSIVDMRVNATAASTVQPSSVCFNCHQLLTPLAHQRLRWDDDGQYRAKFADGTAIDDSDRGYVAGYPYKGSGLSAFAEQAVRKERFLRRMADSQFELLMGRPIRYDTDERDLYRALWNSANRGEGTFRGLLKTILTSEAYQNPVGSRFGDASGPVTP